MTSLRVTVFARFENTNAGVNTAYTILQSRKETKVSIAQY